MFDLTTAQLQSFDDEQINFNFKFEINDYERMCNSILSFKDKELKKLADQCINHIEKSRKDIENKLQSEYESDRIKLEMMVLLFFTATTKNSSSQPKSNSWKDSISQIGCGALKLKNIFSNQCWDVFCYFLAKTLNPDILMSLEAKYYKSLIDEIMISCWEIVENPEAFDLILERINDEHEVELLLKIAEKYPERVYNEMHRLISLLDSQHHLNRAVIISVMGILIVYLSSTGKEAEQYYDIFAERMLDAHYVVRSRVFKILIDLQKEKLLPTTKRTEIMRCTLLRLRDKNSNVRKKALEFLIAMIENNPFTMEQDNGSLSSILFQTQRDDIRKLIAAGVEEEKLLAIKQLLVYYEDGYLFTSMLDEACVLANELLTSLLKTEIVQVMRFFMIVKRFDVEGSKHGIEMVHKVWTEPAALLQCFEEMYLDYDERKVCVELENLVKAMSFSELESLRQVMKLLVSEEKISKLVISELWSDFKRGSFEALVLLTFIGTTISDNLDILTRIGLGQFAENFKYVQQVCLALTRIPERLPPSHPTIIAIKTIVLKNSESPEWFEMAGPAILAMYHADKGPTILQEVISIMSERVFGEGDTSLTQGINNIVDRMGELSLQSANGNSSEETDSFKLAQLLFVVGHVAVCELIHLEEVEQSWKQRNEKQQRKSNEEELEMATGTASDEFQDVIQGVREREIVFGPNTVLSTFAPVIINIITHRESFDELVQTMAALALTKFMCVSSCFCEAYLELFFMLLERGSVLTRSNMVIAFGDLVTSFNSILDPHVGRLYARLADDDFNVRKNAMMTLIFLILNGMIKVKGQISEMARCVEDDDDKIKHMARGFFKELSTKDNAIYNNIADIISNLSNVDEQKYHKICKFIFDFIGKDRQQDAIVEKLCVRFQHADTERQWRDIAYCLSLLGFQTEKSVRKLQEGLHLYADKLHENFVWKCIQDCLKKTKPECKILVEDFKAVLEKCRDKALENWKAAGRRKSEVALVLPVVAEDDVSTNENDIEEGNDVPETNQVLAEDMSDKESEGTLNSDFEEVAEPAKVKKTPIKKRRRKVVDSEDD